jgi:integration host factor subunit alpha
MKKGPFPLRVIDIGQMLNQAAAAPDRLELRDRVKRFGQIVDHATSRAAGIEAELKPICGRLLNQHPCAGAIEVRLFSEKRLIYWQCPQCGDDGMIIGWKGLIWDKTIVLNPMAKRHPGARGGAVTKDFIARVLAAEGKLSFKRAEGLVETLIGLIKDRLGSGEDVLIRGFGRFCVRSKKERKGRDPITGASMMLKPRKIVTFRCSDRLKKKLNP